MNELINFISLNFSRAKRKMLIIVEIEIQLRVV